MKDISGDYTCYVTENRVATKVLQLAHSILRFEEKSQRF